MLHWTTNEETGDEWAINLDGDWHAAVHMEADAGRRMVPRFYQIGRDHIRIDGPHGMSLEHAKGWIEAMLPVVQALACAGRTIRRQIGAGSGMGSDPEMPHRKQAMTT